MRVLKTRKGLEVNTHLSDDEAASIVSALRTNKFGLELVNKYRHGVSLSEDQLAWVHKIALDATGKSNQVTLNNGPTTVNLLPIYKFIKQGHKGGGFPLLRISLPDKRTLFIGLKSGATSANPWQVQIRCGTWDEGGYFGRIDTLGVFYKTRECGDDIVEFLKKLAENPALTLADAGRAAGICPLCGQDLTTAAAAAHGYGEACAHRYLLPWTEIV